MNLNRSIAVIIPAAGSGRRFGSSHNKLFATLAGKPMWLHSVEKLIARPEVACVILAVSAEDEAQFNEQLHAFAIAGKVRVCLGGDQRSDSVAAALASLDDDESIRFVAVHDAARPLVKPVDLSAVFDAAATSGAAILASPVTGTVKKRHSESQTTTVDRRELWIALTPQVFRIDLLRSAYARHRGRPATDDAELVERSGHPVAIVPGSADNLKITFPEDLAIAEAILKQHDQSPKSDR